MRDEIIGQYGVEVLRCKNEEVYSDLSGIFEKISPYASSPLRRGLR
ncbi:MAG: hypothetical protein H6767_08150 [Candidatus Peribacteria bacterium]|nr:MAG: hypothetical protein H6767_08150 [Candidatus Peribacteria bacterium]